MIVKNNIKYKVTHGRKKYYGTPEKIVEQMSSWDRSRPKDDPSFVKDNHGYIKLYFSRVSAMNIETSDSITSECEFLEFLLNNEDLQLEKSN